METRDRTSSSSEAAQAPVFLTTSSRPQARAPGPQGEQDSTTATPAAAAQGGSQASSGGMGPASQRPLAAPTGPSLGRLRQAGRPAAAAAYGACGSCQHLALATSTFLSGATSWGRARSTRSRPDVRSLRKDLSHGKARWATPVDIGLGTRVSSQARVSGDQQETRPALVPRRNVATRGPAKLDKPASLPEDVCPHAGQSAVRGQRASHPGSPLELVVISPRDSC